MVHSATLIMYVYVILLKKCLGEQNTNIFGPWINLIENLSVRRCKQKPRNSDKFQALIMEEWAAISQDVAHS